MDACIRSVVRMMLSYVDSSRGISGDVRARVVDESVECLVGVTNKLYEERGRRLIESIVSGMLRGLRRTCRRKCVILEVAARLVYRGAPGRGAVNPLAEFGVQLHPVYLFPYIPGSSLKGLLRSVYVKTLSSTRCGCEDRLVERCTAAIFGSAGDGLIPGISAVTVTDAYPIDAGQEGLLVGDVLTPHYTHGGVVVRGEDEAAPVPVKGFSVGEGTLFKFFVVVDEWYLRERIGALGVTEQQCISCVVDVPSILDLVAYLLVRGLEYEGVGGKTSRGYGVMRIEKLRIH